MPQFNPANLGGSSDHTVRCFCSAKQRFARGHATRTVCDRRRFPNATVTLSRPLVGDQIDPENPRRWMLVKREQAISTGETDASAWSIDHLFLDQDGIPTLVEIKRQSDSRIRREVVGQMLDYAANCLTYWSLELLQAGLEATCAGAGRSSDAALNELLGSDQSTESFWQQVKTTY